MRKEHTILYESEGMAWLHIYKSWYLSGERSQNRIFDSSQPDCLYFNARSLLPKLDDFKLLCSARSPDIICIVESWLSSEISNLEISLPNFLYFRLVRNCHGGGIVVFVKLHLSVSPLPLPLNNLEFLPLQITCHHLSFTLGTFYCPPNLDGDLNLLVDVLSF